MPRTARSSTGGTGPTRRSVLVLGAAAAGLGAAAVGGCTDLTSTGRTQAPGADADAVLVGQARAALRSTIDRVRRTTQRHPSFRTRLAPVLALHTTHLDALGRSRASPAPTAPSTTQSTSPSTTADTTAPGTSVPGQPAAALAAITAGEHALHAQLTGCAQRAQSGELARLLGAMAAGTSQLLADRPA